MSRSALVRSVAELAEVVDRGRGPVALVMTMGALHAGHAELIRAARREAATVVVSVFVNPLQFGAAEDFDRYPRDLDDDLELCSAEEADVVFAPTADEVYPAGEPMVRLDPGPVARTHEGALRPDLFPGILTVVTKFFHLVRPDVAVFGEKDAQQLALVRRMVADLNFPVRIVGVPTVREPDGVAMSSRNAYLSPAERVTARSLSRALRAARDHRDTTANALAAATGELEAATRLDPPLLVKSLTIVDAETFAVAPEDFRGAAVLGVIARVGDTHLVDHLPVVIGD
ncbi:pantoate--beta-alanine ligase [Umezawaea endophytica]|uniref:Pantothenate synthetase n=1 Tax=Umezawaea endophytica TaxID=1654476 RepID=A0A9X2VJT6_9PSEU|nr:pantoate--beta-alanine ligase [Umezawaea endophytica]MCS7477955.1 pantoate--beta-alanine ligase [Umezawaea endophytica]